MKRRGAIVLLCLVVVPLLYAFYLASSLIALILEDGLDDAVSLTDIEAHGNMSDALHPIPKIIHQTWKNEHVPEHWQIAQFTWYALSFNGGLRLTWNGAAEIYIRIIITWYSHFYTRLQKCLADCLCSIAMDRCQLSR